jgi:hypothetical protein
MVENAMGNLRTGHVLGSINLLGGFSMEFFYQGNAISVLTGLSADAPLHASRE